MFSVYDGRKAFFQWDLDRKLIVNDASINQVHFCNRTDTCSLVCEVYEENGQRLVNVPNVLLQTDWRINVYGYDKNYTKHSAVFEVIKRTKPDDYTYTDTEILNYSKLDERIATLEQNKRGIVEIANNIDVSAVSSFSYSKDIDGNPLKVNDFWIVLNAPNVRVKSRWIELFVNGVQLLRIYYHRNERINLHTVIHKDYCEHTLYATEGTRLSGAYVGSDNDQRYVYRFIGNIGTDLTKAEKTITFKYNYGINDPAWGEDANLWVWGEQK